MQRIHQLVASAALAAAALTACSGEEPTTSAPAPGAADGRPASTAQQPGTVTAGSATSPPATTSTTDPSTSTSTPASSTVGAAAGPCTEGLEVLQGEQGTDDTVDDVAVSGGASCDDAIALIGQVRDDHSFYDGPRRFVAEGYDCEVSTEDDGIPVGRYVCRTGDATVSWTKT